MVLLRLRWRSADRLTSVEFDEGRKRVELPTLVTFFFPYSLLFLVLVDFFHSFVLPVQNLVAVVTLNTCFHVSFHSFFPKTMCRTL